MARVLLRCLLMAQIGLAMTCCLAIACAGSQAGQATLVSSEAAVTAATPSSSAAQNQPAAAAKESAHALIVASVACWLGGVWSDAQSASEQVRADDAHRNCRELVIHLYGADDQSRYERLRAVEAVEVSDLKGKVLEAARAESLDRSREENLARLLDAIANAERETMYARRAGDRVKKDIEGERSPDKLSPDEAAAVIPLRQSQAFDALLTLDVGDLTHEARAIAILCALDRMEIAHGLTKHLKVYAVERPYAAFFGVAAPEVPSAAQAPLPGGTWLKYLTAVAAAAGHPVPPEAQSPSDRELLAWGGVLAGFADKLRVEAASVSDSTRLERVLEAVTNRLDIQYRASQSHVLRQPDPATNRRPPPS